MWTQPSNPHMREVQITKSQKKKTKTAPEQQEERRLTVEEQKIKNDQLVMKIAREVINYKGYVDNSKYESGLFRY